MSEKDQIEAMAKVMCKYYGTEKCYDCPRCCNCRVKYEAEKLYSEGFRLQSEGEWVRRYSDHTDHLGTFKKYDGDFCSICGVLGSGNFCPNCGAKMKGV